MNPRCDSCGRPLTDPASIAAGLGPVCRRALRPTSPSPGAQAALFTHDSLSRPATAAPKPRRLRRVVTLTDLAHYQPKAAAGEPNR